MRGVLIHDFQDLLVRSSLLAECYWRKRDRSHDKRRYPAEREVRRSGWHDLAYYHLPDFGYADAFRRSRC